MIRKTLLIIILLNLFFAPVFTTQAQNSTSQKFSSPSVYSGIEVGSKGVKMSIVEVGENAKSTGAFTILKDTTSNTDFISFDEPSFSATLNSLSGMYQKAQSVYQIPSKRIFTVISSGVKMQAEKNDKSAWVRRLVDSFKTRINDSKREVEIVDVAKESKLSHLGIVPESRRYTTFLLDIGSGNTKGGFFPNGNTDYFKMFQINWGTKSTSNDAQNRCGDDKSLENYEKQLQRTLYTAENTEIIYAVNSSGAYPLSDNIAVSGGIAWAVATLLHPEMLSRPVISVTYEEVARFNQKLYNNYDAFSAGFLSGNINRPDEKAAVFNAVSTVNKVFDQKSMMAGTGLLLKIMRQFASAFETKQFFLVKNGQVGWVSAYVDQSLKNQ